MPYPCKLGVVMPLGINQQFAWSDFVWYGSIVTGVALKGLKSELVGYFICWNRQMSPPYEVKLDS